MNKNIFILYYANDTIFRTERQRRLRNWMIRLCNCDGKLTKDPAQAPESVLHI